MDRIVVENDNRVFWYDCKNTRPVTFNNSADVLLYCSEPVLIDGKERVIHSIQQGTYMDLSDSYRVDVIHHVPRVYVPLYWTYVIDFYQYDVITFDTRE